MRCRVSKGLGLISLTFLGGLFLAAGPAFAVSSSADAGICGPAAKEISATPPKNGDLCAAGYSRDVTEEKNRWRWTCYGSATSATCAAMKKAGKEALAAIDGACGPADGLAFDRAPTDPDLCTYGVARGVKERGKEWIWNCYGQASVISCAATEKPFARTPQDYGACGPAHRQVLNRMPVGLDLCSAGLLQRKVLNLATLWTWTCSGSTASSNCWAEKGPEALQE